MCIGHICVLWSCFSILFVMYFFKLLFFNRVEHKKNTVAKQNSFMWISLSIFFYKGWTLDFPSTCLVGKILGWPNISSEILECTYDGRFTIPWGHKREVVNDSAVTQLMLVVHDYIHTIYNRGRQRRSLSADVLQSLAQPWKNLTCL